MTTIPARAYLVVSDTDPATNMPVADWKATVTRSIHLCPHEAKKEADFLRQQVFDRLYRAGGQETETYVDRLLAYRKSVKIVVCRLDKIAVALIE